jgi:hypothetical protein
MGGANQQERLEVTEEAKWFLAGFIEGEGSLLVSIKHHETSRYGYYVDPEFHLVQHRSGLPLLKLAQQVFGTGRIFPRPGSPNCYVYAIHCRRSLWEKVVPYFEKYVVPFSCKRETFYRFREILELMNQGEHRRPEGLARIVEKAYALNPAAKGKQRLRPLHEVISRILRDHTPDASQTPAE